MEDKTFVWTPELTKKFFKLRFEHEWLFQQKKQPWHEFRQIMLVNGFPEEMTIDHVRKKWSYTYDCYKLAKKSGNRGWVYYKLFDKHFGKKEVLDKYESWNDEWRLKLIICMTEAREMKLEYKLIWTTIETALRSQELPIDCCIQDIKGLWHHIVTTFNRKHRIKIKKGAELTDWPLYEAMLVFYQKFEPDHLLRLESESAMTIRERKSNKHLWRQVDPEQECDFHWTKDITETFIQLRLQYDSIFKEKKWAWGDLQEIMIKEHGFPETLSSRELCRKWAWTYAEYQKAKATNKPWVYADLFELYLGEGNLSLNPIVGWKEEWIKNLITARTDFEHLFKFPNRERENQGWRDVEKALRTMGLPLDHSVLELRDLWTYLVRTYRWKRKFADRGTLTEQWPYFEAMARYKQVQATIQLDPNISPPIKVKRERSKKRKYSLEDNGNDDDWDDDIKLFDLKQKLSLKPKFELPDAVCCRTCEVEEGAVNIYEYIDELGLDVAFKLRVVGGVEVERTDNLPSHLCYNCLQQLEDAFKFRQKCQEADKNYRKNPPLQIKDEMKPGDLNKSKTDDENYHDNDHDDHMEEPDRTDLFDIDVEVEIKPKESIKSEKPRRKRRKPKKVPSKYDYCKICEVCGKYTRNLKNHMDMHGSGKTYTCEICDKKFKFKSGLVIHKAVHDPSPRKTCEVCGKTFHILAQYRRHFVYHANERKYECETCGKRFNTMDILKVHARIHTDERPFSCSDCGKTFRTAGCVSRHKRIVHRKQAKMQLDHISAT